MAWGKADKSDKTAKTLPNTPSYRSLSTITLHNITTTNLKNAWNAMHDVSGISGYCIHLSFYYGQSCAKYVCPRSSSLSKLSYTKVKRTLLIPATLFIYKSLMLSPTECLLYSLIQMVIPQWQLFLMVVGKQTIFTSNQSVSMFMSFPLPLFK